METEHNDLPEWRPDELLEQAATRRGFTVERFRARVRAVADDARKVGGHVSFEQARHLDLSDEEYAHAERCRFCRDLLLTIHPKEDVVRAFEDYVLQKQRPPSWRPATTGHHVMAVAIALFFMNIGINIWPSLSPPATTPNTFLMKETIAGLELALVDKKEAIEALELALVDKTAEVDLKQLFAKAADYQQRGKIDSANAFVLVGLDTAGLKQSKLKIVAETLKAENLDARAKVGNEVQRYKDVLTFLESNEPDSLATKAYHGDFIDRIVRTSAASQSSTGDQSP
ncbi:MAG: hypothetical protein MN733_22540, partial [Nitrososphaera sp.]|nr:hypothetical protein [Nitrososphaera sp.]